MYTLFCHGEIVKGKVINKISPSTYATFQIAAG